MKFQNSKFISFKDFAYSAADQFYKNYCNGVCNLEDKKDFFFTSPNLSEAEFFDTAKKYMSRDLLALEFDSKAYAKSLIAKHPDCFIKSKNCIVIDLDNADLKGDNELSFVFDNSVGLTASNIEVINIDIDTTVSKADVSRHIDNVGMQSAHLELTSKNGVPVSCSYAIHEDSLGLALFDKDLGVFYDIQVVFEAFNKANDLNSKGLDDLVNSAKNQKPTRASHTTTKDTFER